MLDQICSRGCGCTLASPFAGADIDYLVYPQGDVDVILAQTKHAITLCLADGYKRQDIAIASFRGRERTVILELDTLGDAHALKSFTGKYDLSGDQVFRKLFVGMTRARLKLSWC